MRNDLHPKMNRIPYPNRCLASCWNISIVAFSLSLMAFARSRVAASLSSRVAPRFSSCRRRTASRRAMLPMTLVRRRSGGRTCAAVLVLETVPASKQGRFVRLKTLIPLLSKCPIVISSCPFLLKHSLSSDFLWSDNVFETLLDLCTFALAFQISFGYLVLRGGFSCKH